MSGSFEYRIGQSGMDADDTLSQSNSEQILEADAKRGKICASEPRLVMVLFYTGLQIAASFQDQSPNAIMQNKLNQIQIIFDTQV